MLRIKKKNKRGMLANLIGGFIIIFVVITLFGTISQEVENAFNCNISINNSEETPIGETNSFGGGGSGQFGGYDGKVHKSWTSSLSIIKTNQSIINPNCEQLSELSQSFLKTIPFVFLVLSLITGVGMIFKSTRSTGFGEDFL